MTCAKPSAACFAAAASWPKVASAAVWSLFVGTKRQAKEAIEREAARCGMPYVSERWLGGTLTNYRTIRDRLKRLQELEVAVAARAAKTRPSVDMPSYMKTMLNEAGKLDFTKAPETRRIRGYSKKMVAQLNRELTKIQRNLLGIRDMNRLPDAMVVVDPKREHIAVKEAQRMGVADRRADRYRQRPGRGRSADSGQRRQHPLDRVDPREAGRRRHRRQEIPIARRWQCTEAARAVGGTIGRAQRSTDRSEPQDTGRGR